MKRSLSLCFLSAALAASIAGCSRPRPPADATGLAHPSASTVRSANTAPAAVPATTRVTVYSGDYDALATPRNRYGRDVPGYALVNTQLRYSLSAGDNIVTLRKLPHAIDVAAVALHPANDASVAIDGQRFIAPPGDAAAVLADALGRRVAVEHTAGGAKQTDNGILVSAGNGLVLALSDGRTKVIREYDNFSLLDGTQPAAEPTLRWRVSAQRSGDAGFALSYPTGGLAWHAEYLATLGTGTGCTLSLEGAALVANRSGVDFPKVALTLVAGEPNRVKDDSPVVFDTAAAPERFAADNQSMPQPRASGEYYAYPIPLRTTLADDAIERVPLFARAPAVACERAYETSPAINVWPPPRPLIEPDFNQQDGTQPVKTIVSFTNDKASGLGQPLPAGRVRVFDGGDFLGESQLSHTAQGGKLRFDVGNVFDLSAERTRNDFRVDRTGRTMTEAFTVELRNAKNTDAVVQVIEPLPRWTDWDVVASSVPATKRDAQHAQFDVPVPAGGEATLTYTVRYRWPQGMRP